MVCVDIDECKYLGKMHPNANVGDGEDKDKKAEEASSSTEEANAAEGAKAQAQKGFFGKLSRTASSTPRKLKPSKSGSGGTHARLGTH